MKCINLLFIFSFFIRIRTPDNGDGPAKCGIYYYLFLGTGILFGILIVGIIIYLRIKRERYRISQLTEPSIPQIKIMSNLHPHLNQVNMIASYASAFEEHRTWRVMATT